jgi:hypothetical protein
MDKNICDLTTHLSIIGGNTYENGKRKYKLLFHVRSAWFSERLIRRKYPLLLINFLESNITFTETILHQITIQLIMKMIYAKTSQIKKLTKCLAITK